MITAVDTNVLLDVFLDDPSFAAWSLTQLKTCYEEGALIISEIVYAELASAFAAQKQLDETLGNLGIRLAPSKQEVLWKAAEIWKTAIKTRKTLERRILPDFLIGAHALKYAGRLLTRDRGFYKSYFQDLTCMTPS